MSKSLEDIRLNDLLPNSISNDEIIKELSSALSNELQNITNNIDKILFYPNILELPEDIIDLLAKQFQVSFYDVLGLDLATKRELVQNSIIWHKRKGTKAVMQEMIGVLYDRNCIVQEWFEYGGNPYYFKVFIDNIPFNETDLENILDIINTLKNVRSHLESITVKLTVIDNVYVGTVIIKKAKSQIKADMVKRFQDTLYSSSLIVVKRKLIVKGSEVVE